MKDGDGGSRMSKKEGERIVSFFFLFKEKTAYEVSLGLVGSERCVRDRRLRPREYRKWTTRRCLRRPGPSVTALLQERTVCPQHY